MNKNFTAFLVSGMILLISLCALADNREIEPNNTDPEATVVKPGAVDALINDNKDLFKVTLPGPGPVTLRLSGIPDGLSVQLGQNGLNNIGWKDGEGNISYSFKAVKNTGIIWVNFNFVQTVCGYDWCAAKMKKGGKWYATKPSKDMPPSHDGVAIIHKPVSYKLHILTSGNTVSGPVNVSGKIYEKKEPNNTDDEASPAGVGTVKAEINDNKDLYRLTLPAAGKVTLRLKNLPAGLPVQIGANHFGRIGWKDGKGNIEYSFDAEKTAGIVWVNFQFYSMVCGYDWCAAQLEPGGPYYVTKPGTDMPSSKDGKPVIHDPFLYELFIGMEGSGQKITIPENKDFDTSSDMHYEEGDIGG